MPILSKYLKAVPLLGTFLLVAFLQGQGVPPAESANRLQVLKEFASSMELPGPYTREVFTYPRYNRPDPVVPPASILAKDEEVPTLVVAAIIYDAKNPKLSVAILRIGNMQGKQHRVSEGDRIGQIEIEKIEGGAVTIVTHGLGTKRREVLQQSKTTP